MNKLFKQRFEELNLQADEVETSTAKYHLYGNRLQSVDEDLLLNWTVGTGSV